MKVTKDFVTSEVAALNEILPIIDFNAYAEEDEKTGKPYIGLIDTQGANLGSVESEKFYCARDAVERLEHYFEADFLQGEILCDEPGMAFDNYEDAEAYARKAGYVSEADAVKQFLSFFAGPEQIVLQTENATFLLTQDEIDAAHEYGKRQEAYGLVDNAINRLVLGDLFWLMPSDEISNDKREKLQKQFERRFGVTPTEASAYYADDIVDRFLQKYSPYEDWSAAGQAYFYAMEVLNEKRKEVNTDG